MIERFNFYDIYGYLFPGLALLGVVWLPFWFVGERELPAEWSSAIVVLAMAYVVGHVLSRVAQAAYPHGRKTGAMRRRPSDYLLDDDDPYVASETKAQVIRAIRRRFRLETGSSVGSIAERTKLRDEAFLLCRGALLQQKVGAYAEQFEGLYVALRGWAVVAAFSCAYHGGWAIGLYLPLWAHDSAKWLLLLCVILAIAGATSNWLFWLVLVTFVPAGVVGVSASSPSREAVVALVVVALGSLFLWRLFLERYRYFAERFAATVYRDFLVLERYPGRESKT